MAQAIQYRQAHSHILHVNISVICQLKSLLTLTSHSEWIQVNMYMVGIILGLYAGSEQGSSLRTIVIN